MDPKGADPDELRTELADMMHLGEACPKNRTLYDSYSARDFIKFCDKLRRSQAMSMQPAVALCVKDAPQDGNYEADAIPYGCFPVRVRLGV